MSNDLMKALRDSLAAAALLRKYIVVDAAGAEISRTGSIGEAIRDAQECGGGVIRLDGRFVYGNVPDARQVEDLDVHPSIQVEVDRA